jgi:alpha-L-rhamnosidase
VERWRDESCAAVPGPPASYLAVGALTVNGLADPLGIGDPAPSLSWRLTATRRGAVQMAYQVLVATDPTRLAPGRADLWNSGKVSSRDSVGIRYGGTGLGSRTRAHWAVRAWDGHDQPSPWSGVGFWETGLLQQSDWSARWIVNPTWLPHSNPVTLNFPIRRGRYVRLDVTRLGKPLMEGWPYPVSRLQLAEMEVYGGVTLLSRATPARASESFEIPGRWQLSAIDDGTLTSDGRPLGYTSYERRDQDLASSIWVELDLGRDLDVDRVVLYPRTDTLTADGSTPNFPENYTVTVRADGETTGQVVASVTGQVAPAPPARPAAMPLFAKEFTVGGPVARARLYATGLGVYEARLNGARVGDAVLEPANTDYRRRVQYATYDVTHQLRPGANVLGFALGNGIYHVPPTPGRYQKFTGSMGPPKLIAQLEVTHADGGRVMIVSDGSWVTTDGPTTFSSWYGGEDYDARREMADWDAAGGDRSGWTVAKETTAPAADTRLSARGAPPIRRQRTLSAVSRTEVAPGVWLYDLGRNIAGWPQVTLTGHGGVTVRLRPSESVRNGRVDQSQVGEPVYFDVTVVGDAAFTWHPSFMYYGFRYLEISGVTNPPPVADVRGVVLRADNERTGSLTTSDPMVSRIHQIVNSAIYGNMFSVLTDCPHREKLGWLEETHLVGETLTANFDLAAYGTAIVRTIADAQLGDGLVPDIAPEYTVFSGGFRDDPNWGGALILLPWQLFRAYGDPRPLRETYPAMTRYMDYLAGRASDHILSYGLGDWAAVDTSTPLAVTATVAYHRLAIAMSAIAGEVGDADGSARYATLAEQIRTSFNAAYLHTDTGSYASGSQAGNALPLWAGMAPADVRDAVVAHIVDDVRARGNHLSTGEIGLPALLDVLGDGGHADLVQALTSNPSSPSYAYQVLHGATTLTELWDGPTAGGSQNHFMLGAIDGWYYRYLGGIRPDTPGYRTFKVAPEVVTGISRVRAEQRSPYGRILSEWSRDGHWFRLTVDTPVNTTATVSVPLFGEDAAGRRPCATAGAKLVGIHGGRAVYRVGSGTWWFITPAPGAVPPPTLVVVEAASAQAPVVPGWASAATYRLTNLSDTAQTVRPEVTVSAGFTAPSRPAVLTIPAGQSIEVAVPVTHTDDSVVSGWVMLAVGTSSATVSLVFTANLTRVATMTASSTWPGFSPERANDGDTSAAHWDDGAGWNDGTASTFPDTLTATWSRPVTIDHVRLYTHPDSRYSLRDYDLQAAVDADWQTVGSVRGNVAGVVDTSFAPVTTTALRLTALAANDGQFSRVIELEAYPPGTAPTWPIAVQGSPDGDGSARSSDAVPQ